jgi:hypothetical protein
MFLRKVSVLVRTACRKETRIFPTRSRVDSVTRNTETMTKQEGVASSCQTITTDCDITDVLSCQRVVNFTILYLEFKCTKSPTNTTTTARERCGDGGGVRGGGSGGLNY